MADKIYNAFHEEIELTSEQKACLKYTGDKVLMVKGIAGAGKSLVLMALADKFIKQYGKDSKNKVAIFTYQNTLVATTREFLAVNGNRQDGVAVSTINAHIYELYNMFIKMGAVSRKKYPASDKQGNEKRLANVRYALKNHETKNGHHRFHSLGPEFWLEEFDWMKQLNVWTDDMEYYLTLPRKGRGGKVRMTATDRVTAYEIFLEYCKYLEKTGQADWADQTLFVIRHPELIPSNMKFENVLIDEAQDLTTAQMLAIMNLFEKNMVVAMDANQKIHNRYWTPRSIGFEAKTQKLTKSMRTTKQIDDLAESVRCKNDIFLSDDDKSERAIPEREGDIPKIVHLESAVAEQKYVVELVKKQWRENPNITIGIIVAMNKQLKIISDWLTTARIPHQQITKDSTFSMREPGVKVVNAFGAKGLEFNSVVIPMFAEGYFPYSYQPDDPEQLEQYMIKMRNLVYVSMTRAKNILTLTYYGNKGSRFIGEMDTTKYILEGAPNQLGESPKNNNPIGPRVEYVFEESRPKFAEKIPKSGSGSVGKNSSGSLTEFLSKKGLKVVDKRDSGGSLWVVGDKSIDAVLKESRKEFGALWIYCEKGGKATNYAPGWFTKSTK